MTSKDSIRQLMESKYNFYFNNNANKSRITLISFNNKHMKFHSMDNLDFSLKNNNITKPANHSYKYDLNINNFNISKLDEKNEINSIYADNHLKNKNKFIESVSPTKKYEKTEKFFLKTCPFSFFSKNISPRQKNNFFSPQKKFEFHENLKTNNHSIHNIDDNLNNSKQKFYIPELNNVKKTNFEKDKEFNSENNKQKNTISFFDKNINITNYFNLIKIGENKLINKINTNQKESKKLKITNAFNDLKFKGFFKNKISFHEKNQGKLKDFSQRKLQTKNKCPFKNKTIQDYQEILKNYKNSLTFHQNEGIFREQSKEEILMQKKLPLEKFQELFINLFCKNKLTKSCLINYYEGRNIYFIMEKISTQIYKSAFEKNFDETLMLQELKMIHLHLGIKNTDYDLFKGLLLISLRESKIDDKIVSLFGKILEKFRSGIVFYKPFRDYFSSETELNEFLNNNAQKILNNEILNTYFNKLGVQKIKMHQKRFFNIIFGNSFARISYYKSLHMKLDFSFFEFFEIKNIMINDLISLFNSELNVTKIIFSNIEIDIFERLESIREIVVNKSKLYDYLENPININKLSLELNSKIMKNFDLKQLFLKWGNEKRIEHCENMLNYLFQTKNSRYNECDLIPAHCRIKIENNQFDNFKFICEDLLVKFDKKIIDRFLIQIKRIKNSICRENNELIKIGGQKTIDNLLNHVYINLFGDPLTKNVFENSDADYVKYKQKIFFCKMLQNKLIHNDLDDLKAIHNKMNITHQQFIVFIKYVREFCDDAHLNKDLQQNLCNQIMDLEKYIVKKLIKI